MKFELTDEQRQIVGSVRSLAQSTFKPRALSYMDGAIPWENMQALAELGVLGMAVPEQYGGLGMSVQDTALVLEEVAKACYVTAMALLGISPYNAYAAADGCIVITAPSDRHFRAILDVIGRPELAADPRFVSRTARVDNMDAVDALIETWTSTNSREEIVQAMLKVSVHCAPVRELSEVVLDENMHAGGTLQRFDHPDLGRAVLPHSPISFDGSPRLPLQASGAPGAENRRVFADWLGLGDNRLEELTAAAVT